MRFAKVSLLVIFCSFFAACGGGNDSGGGAPSSSGSIPSQDIAESDEMLSVCMRMHPALNKIGSFPSMASAVGAFARATRECNPSEKNLRALGRMLVRNNVQIEEETNP